MPAITEPSAEGQKAASLPTKLQQTDEEQPTRVKMTEFFYGQFQLVSQLFSSLIERTNQLVAYYELREKYGVAKEYVMARPLLKWILATVFCGNILPIAVFMGVIGFIFFIGVTIFVIIEGFFIVTSMFFLALTMTWITICSTIGASLAYVWYRVILVVYTKVDSYRKNRRNSPQLTNGKFH